MSKRGSRILLLVIALSALVSVFFGLRSYISFQLLRSAHEAGRPQVSSLRAWMTLNHVAATYHAPLNELIPRLGLPPDINRNESLKSVADKRNIARIDFVRQVQRALGQTAPPPDDAGAKSPNSFLGGIADSVLAAVLKLGYPALAATLLFGAIGLPLPTGLVTLLAGSLTALGRLDLFWTSFIAVMASLGGDVVAYLIGRMVKENFLTHHGRLFGLSPERRQRAQSLFARWGGLTVVFSRTLVSSLSSLTSLLAGLSRYSPFSFIIYSAAGRVLWTSLYLGLGFVIGSNIEAANQFLGNLTGLLAALAVLIISTAYRRNHAARSGRTG
jgi:membrane protein DedA with SNARE-associated domain